MATNYIVKTVQLGKYAGDCPKCKLMRGTEEVIGCSCGRCGHVFETEAIHLDLDGNPVAGKEETNEESV